MLPGLLFNAPRAIEKHNKKHGIYCFTKSGKAVGPLEVPGAVLGGPWRVPGESLGDPWEILGVTGGPWGIPGGSLVDPGGPWEVPGKSLGGS